jgi:S1-C subfamily serine protease
MSTTRKFAALSLAAVAFTLALFASAAQTDPSPPDSALSAAVCPIVYQLDETPSARGYHYTFFGNAFFINEQGYLLTAAHVLDTFRNGGQPYILVNRPNSPPRLLRATVIAMDSQHDVAILRATPNPFDGEYRVAFLPLSPAEPAPGQSVLALSLHPLKPQSAHTFEFPREDHSAGEVLSYQSTQLDKSSPAAQVFLLSHAVSHGQSGSPVVGLDSQAVVGFIEGRWLRSSGVPASAADSPRSSIPGVAVPIRHAIALLQRERISWHAGQLKPPKTSPAPSADCFRNNFRATGIELNLD